MIPHGAPIWHPFTQHALDPAPLRIARTEGAFLLRDDGRPILDAISSWWVITHGHRHPAIVAAIQAAAERLDQVIFAGFTHEPAEDLAEALVRVAPPGLAHVFFSDSGSTSVEVALKMALGTFRNRGAARHRIVVMEASYHGDTIGTMSVGERGVFSRAYEPLLFAVGRIPFPEAGKEQATLDAFAALCEQGDVAALIVEPLVLGAGGMRMYGPAVLAELRRIADRHGVLFIADEVMTGWGRTGSLFACEAAGVAPDILCTSKGLTGGVLPLAATLCRSEIYEAHLSADRSRTFFHSSSFTANPIACAAGLANIRVWEAEEVASRVARLCQLQEARIRRFETDPRFRNVRRSGTITALDLAVPDAGYLAEVGPRLRAIGLEEGVLLRPLGNVVYVLPPYCVTEADLDRVYDVIDGAADAILARGGAS